MDTSLPIDRLPEFHGGMLLLADDLKAMVDTLRWLGNLRGDGASVVVEPDPAGQVIRVDAESVAVALSPAVIQIGEGDGTGRYAWTAVWGITGSGDLDGDDWAEELNDHEAVPVGYRTIAFRTEGGRLRFVADRCSD